MRSIGKVSTENGALRFSSYLKRNDIAHTCDASFDTPSGYISYEFWIHEEDRLVEAKEAFEKFTQNPQDPVFDIPVTEQVLEEERTPLEENPEELESFSSSKRKIGFFTKLVLLLCTFIFCLEVFQEVPLVEEKVPEQFLSFTPIQDSLLYDLPPFFEELSQLMQKHKVPRNQKIEALDPEIQQELTKLPSAVYFRGFYDWCLLKFKTGDASEAEGPLFIKIRQGELWRLVSPCVLHAGLLHILFNMIWVWMLSRPIEQRIGFLRTAFLSVGVAIGSNLVQYLMGGPFFVGYSGVVMGLAGFIWSRQKIAPWEGYPIQKSTLLFLVFFVLAMFGLQLTSFILQAFSDVQFPLQIANTAHIVGGILGALFGRMNFFSWRVR